MNTKPTPDDNAAQEQGQTSSDVSSKAAIDAAKAEATAPSNDSRGAALGRGPCGRFALGE